jgi:hypothetical protein
MICPTTKEADLYREQSLCWCVAMLVERCCRGCASLALLKHGAIVASWRRGGRHLQPLPVRFHCLNPLFRIGTHA